MDWDKVILRLNQCGRSVWPVGHTLTRDWFASRVVDYVFWFIWQGNGFLQEGPKRVRRLRRGVCLLMRPGVRFEVRQEGDSQLGVNFIHFNILPSDSGRAKRLSKELPELCLESTRSGFFEGLTNRIIQLKQERAFLGADVQTRADSVLLQMLRTLLESFEFEMEYEQADTLAGVDRHHRHVVAAGIGILNEQYRERKSVTELAGALGYSRDHFHKVFKDVTGRTPHQVLTAIRMDHAKQLLRHSGMSIGEIAESVGFDNVFHFSRQFKRQMGITPTSFRKAQAGE